MHIRSSVIASAMLLSQIPALPTVAQESVEPPVVSEVEPYEQDFVLTAYYSPLPDQCCYVKGSYEADKILNGDGTHGADGTPVYEGMIAAPPSYPFGTRIVLPGLGTFTVHDRGGAIQEWDDAHRLDVWMGSGEEGLARALAFGVEHVHGTVYLPGTDGTPDNAFDVASVPAPLSYLEKYTVSETGAATGETEAASLTARWGEHSDAARVLQEQLLALGYFTHEVTSYFGDVTRQSLASFMTDMSLSDSPDTLTETVANYLQVAVFYKNAPSPVAFVDETASPQDIRKAQRYLRHIGYYRGRTDGKYSSNLFNAIFAYQRDNGLVANAVSPGAGRIGPITKGVIDRGMLLQRVSKFMQKHVTPVEVATGDSNAL
jgi:peptidoglycan hydrolase-like protein with peptidoglycan-binding domain/3D (Asp-Asp-Asp) domain-containing protein